MADHQYPNAPGFHPGSPETSREAAASVAPAAANRSNLALRFVRERAPVGATSDEVASRYEWERYSSRPRLAELHKRGLIVDSGRRREGASGRKQVVWVVPEYGPAPTDGVQLDLLAMA
ncbi:hypothetical protein GRI40_06430 [Altererythrobacter aerius]|uniref:Uncharacterized protein n=1 Tax=Tsuneonella aeria TaxID=1837929 RepID=A0A6I4TE00_9SPHN|nr:hypothetical protein [Tsuneonella aeria]MXO74856.1 hypothetical protein [Tsuneonella aeria]